ncbi:hypothetical protein [Sciscionella sediminilitoris]|uniref:hypothetical protein n=1 Tax=Sciscionella sediminilitoris TaxID=1445613 RepID=UPI0004DF997D|nr:hypothetical protein [Sciscionella sp. SE31]
MSASPHEPGSPPPARGLLWIRLWTGLAANLGSLAVTVLAGPVVGALITVLAVGLFLALLVPSSPTDD